MKQILVILMLLFSTLVFADTNTWTIDNTTYYRRTVEEKKRAQAALETAMDVATKKNQNLHMVIESERCVERAWFSPRSGEFKPYARDCH